MKKLFMLRFLSLATVTSLALVVFLGGFSFSFAETQEGAIVDEVALVEEGGDESPVPTTATIVAQKVICKSEADLPNWGAGGVDITSTTATDYIASHPNCRLAENWNFEWSHNGVGNPGDNVVSGGEGWNIFSNMTNAIVPAGARIWVREQVDSQYIAFTGENIDQDASAEIYCHNDVLNYDNWEWLDPVEADQTYYCVAFNAPKSCSIVSDETNIIEDGANAMETWDEHTSWYDSALLNPAKWIWGVINVAKPTEDETKVFVKEFTLDAVPLTASIELAADNGFILNVNGVEVVNELGNEFNYGMPKTYSITNLVSGKNTIRLTVKNFAMVEGTPETNPAGVLYKLTVFGTTSCDSVEPIDACANIDGHQSVIPEGLQSDDGGNCVAKPSVSDVCPNIDGVQETVPSGKILSGGNCVDQSSGGGGGSSGYAVSQVLGASTTTGRVLGESICAPYIKSYIKFGAKNDKDDVMRLQTFLNEYLGLKLKVDGLYTASTYNAVKKFQAGAKDQILTPWIPFGLKDDSRGTGYVYKTTKRWINMLKCPQLGLPIPKLP